MAVMKFNSQINIYGNLKETNEAVEKLATINLTGVQEKDRLLIQEHLKDCAALKKRRILYLGNTVYPFETIIKEFKKLKKSGQLQGMTNCFYEFLYLNFDIAHYDKNGYIWTYHNSFNELWNRVLRKGARSRIPTWYTDLKRITDEIDSIMEE